MLGEAIVPTSDQKPASPYFLYLETSAMPFKCLSKTLDANFQYACMMVATMGVMIQESTQNNATMFECFLQRQKFRQFHIPVFADPASVILLGFKVKDFVEQMENVTKTDTIKVFVLESSRETLHFQIEKKGAGGTSNKFISLCRTPISEIISAKYPDHIPTANIQGTRFSSVCTQANKHSKDTVFVQAQAQGIAISSTKSNLKGFRETFGQWVEGAPIVYEGVISTARFSSFSNMAKVSNNVRLYACQDGGGGYLPLKLVADVSDLGSCSLYLSPAETAAVRNEFQQGLQSNAYQQIAY